MMATVAPTMDRNHLRQLLAQVGSMAPETPESPLAENFDWRQCRYFGSDRLSSLQQEVERLLQEMTTAVEACCQAPFSIEFNGMTQQYGSAVIPQIQAMTAGDYALAFGPANEPLTCLLVIPSVSATAWANFALGASSSGETEQENAILSPLEATFLTDLSLAMVQVFAPLVRVDQVVTASAVDNGPAEIVWQPIEALLRVTFTVKQAEAEQGTEGQVILPCALIDGPPEPDGPPDVMSPPTAEGIVKQCLQDCPVPVQVQLGLVDMSFEELANLEPNDILMLDRGMDDPVDVRIGAKRAFAGIPAQRRASKAVLITQSYI